MMWLGVCVCVCVWHSIVLPIPGFSGKPGPGKPGFSEKIRGFPPGTWLFTPVKHRPKNLKISHQKRHKKEQKKEQKKWNEQSTTGL